MLRSARHAKILEIITTQEIETQEELCAELERQNIVVTQATISRDIRDLRLFKVLGVEKTIGRFAIEKAQMGVNKSAGTSGVKIAPPAEREYPVEPVGVAIKTPSPVKLSVVSPISTRNFKICVWKTASSLK